VDFGSTTRRVKECGFVMSSGGNTEKDVGLNGTLKEGCLLRDKRESGAVGREGDCGYIRRVVEDLAFLGLVKSARGGLSGNYNDEVVILRPTFLVVILY